MELILEPMTAEDVPGVARLAGQLGYASTPEQVRLRFAEISREPEHAVIVARVRGQTVGWIHFCRSPGIATDARLLVLGLVVDEHARGVGIGSRLIAEAERWGRSRGLRRVRFTSRVTREDAHRLYRRLGYEVSKTSHVFEKGL